MRPNSIRLIAIAALTFAGSAVAQVSGGGVSGGGVSGGGVSGVSGGLASDFASSTTPAGNTSKVGGLGPALERVFAKQDAEAECAKLGKCDN